MVTDSPTFAAGASGATGTPLGGGDAAGPTPGEDGGDGCAGTGAASSACSSRMNPSTSWRSAGDSFFALCRYSWKLSIPSRGRLSFW